MRVRFSYLLPLIQLVLVIVSVLFDLRSQNGAGEADNQVIANLVSNVEYYIKATLGLTDIVNFRFNFITALLGLLFWICVGFLLDLLRKRRRSIRQG
ncbi:hypothetical protein SD71_10215 [Cohnella kolymensis]|uniref:VanZ-like domain-containing protein n=1 Tax=Cohnella kolymensis TaxID=1590652 RepID=A0ABR5A463_9BACL|nr:hypothetical protein SD71_10215 [Cohnella kolymensis]